MSEDLKLALFDYDGTIVDSEIMIVKGAIEDFKQNLKFLGLKLPKNLNDLFI